jgi:hypothetical protein
MCPHGKLGSWEDNINGEYSTTVVVVMVFRVFTFSHRYHLRIRMSSHCEKVAELFLARSI